MKVKNKKFTTIWIENSEVKIIDQTKLPFEFKVQKLESLNDFCKAITDMKVRGAPLIGVTAAFGFAKSIEQNSSKINIQKCYQKLLRTRPTAINLNWALQRVRKRVKPIDCSERAWAARQEAELIAKEDVLMCESIGVNGLEIFKDLLAKKVTQLKENKLHILTHCNPLQLLAVSHTMTLNAII